MTLSQIWINSPGPNGYEADQAARIAVFNKIAPAPNWKAPVAVWIEASDFEECAAACRFFTGSELKITATSFSKVFVEAAGYYAAIGA